MTKINIGIIGANFGSKVHVPAFKQIQDVNIVAIYSKNINNAISSAAQYNIPIATDNWLDIIKDENIHAITIALPPLESYPVFKAAITHNKHIFCEKPFCYDLSSAVKIKNLLTSNIIHAIDFEICESRIVKKLKDMIDSRYLGDIIDFDFNWKLMTNFSNNSSWKLNVNKGGGALNNFGPHIFHLLEWLFADTMQIVSGKLLPSLDANTAMKMNIEFKSFNGSINIDANTDIPSDLVFKINCDNGSFILRNQTNVLKNFSLSIQQSNYSGPIIIDYENDLSNKDGRIDLVSSLAQRFIDGIKINSQVAPNIEHGVRAQVLSHILLSKGQS